VGNTCCLNFQPTPTLTRRVLPPCKMQVVCGLAWRACCVAADAVASVLMCCCEGSAVGLLEVRAASLQGSVHCALLLLVHHTA
jgi:hypothetical protein